MRASLVAPALAAALALPSAAPAEPLPFAHKVETFREKDSDVTVFCLKLEQPFLAEEFDRSSYLRLTPLDRNAYLIYPTQTRFSQKHAEFYGRLRGAGKAKLRLSYEVVSENLDGSPKVDVRQGDVEVTIPTEPGGPRAIYLEWARQQNAHYQRLLGYYPDESFFQYVLLQSRARYGVEPPPLPRPAPARAAVEEGLYGLVTGSLGVQDMLQQEALTGGTRHGPQDVLIGDLAPPRLASHDYAKLLEEKRTKEKVEPKPHELTRFVPEDHYFLHFRSPRAAGELFDLAADWGDSLLRLAAVQARDNRLQAKFEEQLCLRRGPLTDLFSEGVIADLAVVGSDPFVLEGTDVTVLFRLKKPELFDKAAEAWLADVKKKRPDVAEREFNYRGHKVLARYTNDRVVSSFVVRQDDLAVYSNSHAAVRKVIDASSGKASRLYDALDYRYVTTILPPPADDRSGYLYASEAFVRRMVGPSLKVAEKRRVQCFNNLVMLNNASLMYRLENGRSPASVDELIQGRYVDPDKVVCPHGGAYAVDAGGDTCTCSLHNRLRYLTPNTELPVLRVSRQEQAEYERYRQRYEQFWGTVFDPIAVRITVGPRTRLETCILPFANGSLYQSLRSALDDKPLPLDTARIASSAVGSLVLVPGRKNIAELLKMLPGVPEALRADPTLTDLGWLGDRLSLHVCDGTTILQVDPLHIKPLDLFGIKAGVTEQAVAAALLTAMTLPTYVAIDVEDRDKAERLLEGLSARIFLQRGDVVGLPSALDAYRLPDYKKHKVYVLTFQLYAVKARLHVALVGGQLVAATRPETLREVIDAAANPPSEAPPQAHVLLRLNRKALNRFSDDLQLYWEEKARLACHRNAAAIDTLRGLYEVPVGEVARISEAKYGVVYFCPDHGVYEWDTRRGRVQCSVHGDRQDSRQGPRLDRRSSFAELIEGLDEITATLRFRDDALLTTVEIVRRKAEGK
jgi:hypothetical protein